MAVALTSRGLAAMARLRSASECSLESVESDSDGGFTFRAELAR